MGSSSNVCDRHAYVIDHVDGDRTNNTIDNLRIVSKSINSSTVRRPVQYADILVGEWKPLVEANIRTGYRISSDGRVVNFQNAIVGDINNGRPYALMLRSDECRRKKCFSIKKLLKKYFK